MPNSVYQRVYDGLAAMVSPRAASQALKNALESRGDTPDTVDTDTMIRLIKGSIFREFQLILPRDGLKRNLHTLIRDLESVKGSVQNKEVALPAAPATPFISVRQGVVPEIDTSITLVDEDIVWDTVDPALDAGLDAIMVEDDDETDDLSDVLLIDDAFSESVLSEPLFDEPVLSDSVLSDFVPTSVTPLESPFLIEIEDESREVQQSAEHVSTSNTPTITNASTISTSTISSPSSFSRTKIPSVGQKTRSQPQVSVNISPLAQEQIERITLNFAQIEQVTQVAAMRQRGEVVISRGEGIDLKQLSRLGIMGLHLLRRSGYLRSYYLSHSKGQLFLLPIGQDIIVVAGTPSLNVGEIFSTHNSLESEIQSENA